MTETQATAGASRHWPAKRRVTLVGAAANLGLAAGKIMAGWAGQSQALLVDGVHSLSDLLSDALVLVAARFGSQDADRNHPYGHGRIETLVTAVVGLLLMAVAAGFAIDAIDRLLNPDRLKVPGWLALVAAAASVLVKEALYRYTRHVATRTGSMLIRANAWHHRSDALSSLVVIAGVAGVLAGAVWLDAVAAIVVAAMVGWIGWQFIVEAAVELVDTAVTDDQRRELETIIRSVPEVRGLRRLRTRRMAGQVIMDVQVILDSSLSLAEADRIVGRVRRRLLEDSGSLEDAVVHAVPDRPANADGS